MRHHAIRFWRISHYGPCKAQWWMWRPSIRWSRQGPAWCLDIMWLCFFSSTYWNDVWRVPTAGGDAKESAHG